jgi:hypothetical protein
MSLGLTYFSRAFFLRRLSARGYTALVLLGELNQCRYCCCVQ